MSVSFKILSPGMLSSVQDRGRTGFGAFGVPRSGAADPVSLRIGNGLVGNDPYEAAIEFRFIGPTICCQNGSVRIGLASNAGAQLDVFESKQKRAISPWQSVTLNEGDILKAGALQSGATGYLTVQGGLQLTPVLGSCSTYARARLGGATGDILKASDILTLNRAASHVAHERIIATPFRVSDSPLRVIPGPQDDYFSKSQIAKFLSSTFKVTTDVDRMGIRLEGPKIKPRPEKGSDLISDGLVTGSIQIPGNGQPIILGVECQSIGGYPKIATVISADLHRLGQMLPGDEIRFKIVDLKQAQTALQKLQKSIEASIASAQDYCGEGVINMEALYSANLIDGVINATLPEHPKEKP